MTTANKDIMRLWQKDPFLFIKDMRGLEPQPIKEEYKEQWEEALATNDSHKVKLEWFKPFMMGRHITWQQAMIVNSIKKGIRGEDSWKVSIRSGHGIGKSTIIAMIVIWGLVCYYQSQIPCTAPNQAQLQDVLWKELSIWIGKLPEDIQKLFIITSDYIRISGEEKEWFARAKTGRKESPEALAGVHSNSLVALIADEASGVDDVVFNFMKGALTNKNILMLFISNPTRTNGYFYESQVNAKLGFQVLAFSSLESPVVDYKLQEDIINQFGPGSDEYKIRVLGEFPDADGADEDGWIPLFSRDDLNLTTDGRVDGKKLGVDPAGDGSDEDIVVVRDEFKAKIASAQKKSDAKKTAQIAGTVALDHKIKQSDIIIDNFGVGANVGMELAVSGIKPTPINVGETKLMSHKDQKRFVNLRAKLYRDLREWLKKGGELVNDRRWDDLLYIRYKRNTAGKIQIMSKKDMKKKLGKSPDAGDALMLTFYEKGIDNSQNKVIKQNW